MRLTEAQAKRLLTAYGVEVPRGERWVDLPGPWWPGGVVVKAQTLGGGRGLRGGIRVCREPADVAKAARDLLGRPLGDEVVDELRVEELIAVRREFYLAVTVDRESGASRVLLGRDGGVGVEQGDAPIASIVLTPDTVPDDAAIERLRADAGLDDIDVRGLGDAVRRLCALFREQDAELVEVNPLALTDGGRLIALDARVVLDDNAAFRHPDWPVGGTLGTAFERACADLGVAAVEMQGDIVLIVSGAGLMMATLDLVTHAGGAVRAALDLGGLVLREADELADLVSLVAGLRPRAVLVNAFFQLATCDALARGLAAGLARTRLDAPLVVRLRGRERELAHRLLEPYGVIEEPDLGAACSRVVSLARAN